MSLSFQIRRLARHSAIYGLGGILSRVLAVLLLPLYTSYLGTAGFGKIEQVTALTTVLVIVLSAGISSAFFRFYFDTKDAERRIVVVRTTFWFTMTMATVGLDHRLRVRDSDRAPAQPRRRPMARAGRRGRPLGADELLAADEPVPRRGARGPVRDREHREHPDHRRHDRSPRRRARQGRNGSGRRQLHRHARDLSRAARLPALPARSAVRSFALPRDEPLRHAARSLGAVPLGDQLRRPDLRRPLQGHLRGRRLLARRTRVERDRLPDDRVPSGVARVRLLDRRRVCGAADLRVRPHLPALHLLLDVARARRVRSVDREDPRAVQPRLLPRRRGRRPPLVRRERLRGLHRARDRHRPRAGGRSSTGSSAVSPRS